jgi:cyclopropane fatty-acyl-phospholipid synthase-like methyltransferase
MHEMNATPDPLQFFTKRARAYSRFIRLVGYQQGLRAYLTRSPLLRPGIRVLDAGCGTGALVLALHDAFVARELPRVALRAFDLTPAMLDQLRATVQARGIAAIELAQADVLALQSLPVGWRDFDLIVTASMLEYVPRDQFVAAISGLRALLNDGGSLLLFVTRDNWLMRPLIGRWWRSNLYSARQLTEAFASAGFSAVAFRRFPPLYRYLESWGHVIEAER